MVLVTFKRLKEFDRTDIELQNNMNNFLNNFLDLVLHFKSI